MGFTSPTTVMLLNFDPLHLSAAALVLAVLMHVGWNLLAKKVHQEVDLLWWALLGFIVLFGWIGIYALWQYELWTIELVQLVLITTLAITLYFVALRWAYQGAPASLVYPIARSSPLLIAVWMSLFWQSSMGLFAWIGVSLTVIALLALAWQNRAQATLKSVIFAATAAFFTSIYSISDYFIAQSFTEIELFIGLVTVAYVSSWLALSLLRYQQHKQIIPKQRPSLSVFLIASSSVGFAYVLTIYAMRDLSAVYVVSMTNMGIVIVFLLSIFWLKEPVNHRNNWIAIAVLMMGLLVLSVSRNS